MELYLFRFYFNLIFLARNSLCKIFSGIQSALIQLILCVVVDDANGGA